MVPNAVEEAPLSDSKNRKETRHHSLIELLALLNKQAAFLLTEADKDVRDRAQKVLPLELRTTQLCEDLILWHIGEYMRSNESFNILFLGIKDADDQLRIANNLPLLTYDEAWDLLAPTLLTFVRGFIAVHNLEPKIPAGKFIPFYHEEEQELR